MQPVPIPIANGYYVSDSSAVSTLECENCYPVVEEAPALSQETLRATPGLRSAVVAGSSPCRGSLLFQGLPYFLQGTTLYRLNADETVTDVSGGLAIPGTATVSMAENGEELCVLVPGVDGYIYDGATLQIISDGDFKANGIPTAVTFIDGYFLFTTDDNKIIVSNLRQGLVYTATDFEGVESSTDDVVAPVVFKNQLWVGGGETYEAFANIGGTGFPFQRVNLFLTKGLSGRFAVQVTADTFVWIGAGKREKPSVYAIEGNDTVKVSNRAVDSLLGGLTTAQLNAVTSWTYSQDGHYFIGWNLPTTTIVYDTSTQRWHIRSSRLMTAPNEFDVIPFRGVFCLTALGRLYCGDSQNGTIGELSLTEFTEYGEEFSRVFSTQTFTNNEMPFSVSELELTLEGGVGSLTEDPQVGLQVSYDGGESYGDLQWRTLGKRGERRRRTIWRRLGNFDPHATFRFVFTDAFKFVPIKLQAMVDA